MLYWFKFLNQRGDTMKAYRECVEMRTALAEEFRELKPLFAALGDENRQVPRIRIAPPQSSLCLHPF